jgi:hypothetical protein
MRLFLLLVTAVLITNHCLAETHWVTESSDGSLVYRKDKLGNQSPDFSHIGYHSRTVPLPALSVIYTP